MNMIDAKPVYKPGTRIIAAVRLNERGLDAAQTVGRAA